jgi:hypothetical protein
MVVLDHMLFKCPVARNTWSIVACVLDDNSISNDVDGVCAWVKSFMIIEMQQFIVSGMSLVFWALWKCRNRACFQNIFLVDPK